MDLYVCGRVAVDGSTRRSRCLPWDDSLGGGFDLRSVAGREPAEYGIENLTL